MDNATVCMDSEEELNNGPGQVFLLVFLSVQGNNNNDCDNDN